jgi:ketosteroid isomerase-like protein
MTAETEIQTMVERETQAWDRQDAEALVSLFHPDMVWPWPPDPSAHDPATWVFPLGRYNRERWRAGWEELFRTHELVHNIRRTVRITVSPEGDGGFAVVDVDTLWRRRTDASLFHWKGRACKGYTRVGARWLLICHTGLLEYGHGEEGRATSADISPGG